MPFSEATQERINDLAECCEEQWAHGSVPKGFDWSIVVTIVLGLIQNLCKPKSAEARTALIKKWAAKAATVGCDGCCDCLTQKQRERFAKRMAKKAKVKGAAMQSRMLYTVVMAANADKATAVAGMESAAENDETDDDE